MVTYFRKTFESEEFISIYVDKNAGSTWWEIKPNCILTLNKSLKGVYKDIFTVEATKQRIDRSKELSQMLRDKNW